MVYLNSYLNSTLLLVIFNVLTLCNSHYCISYKFYISPSKTILQFHHLGITEPTRNQKRLFLWNNLVCIVSNQKHYTYMCVESVRHQFKLSIRWNEWNCAIIFKPWQTYTLMKFHIFKLYCLALTSCEVTFKSIIFRVRNNGWPVIPNKFQFFQP